MGMLPAVRPPLALILLAACTEPPAHQLDVSGTADCAGDRCAQQASCPDGFEHPPSGIGCVEIAFDGDCPAGSMPSIGHRDCVPVGWNNCPAGFAPDPSGWGCADISPAQPCSG